MGASSGRVPANGARASGSEAGALRRYVDVIIDLRRRNICQDSCAQNKQTISNKFSPLLGKTGDALDVIHRLVVAQAWHRSSQETQGDWTSVMARAEAAVAWSVNKRHPRVCVCQVGGFSSSLWNVLIDKLDM